ncbi:unnamed protein product [Bathycoccus prasinos]
MTTKKKKNNTVIIETLLNWGRENGIRTHPNVAIQQRIIKNGDEDDEEDERGIFYVRLDDERDDVNDVNDATMTTTETLVSIPEKALLCVPRRRTETVTKGLEEEEDDSLCEILLRETKKNTKNNNNESGGSFWSAYLRTLPNEYDLLELWTDEEIEMLQVDAAKASARELRGKVSASYDRQCKKTKNAGIFFTRAEWAYAKATVRSRTVSVPWSSAGALAPIGDMFNYAPVGGFLGGDDDGNGNFCNGDEKEDGCVPVGTGAWNANENAFEFQGTLPKKFSPTTRSFELFMNYGAYTNLELLSLYGFHCGENNPNDVIVLDVPLITAQTTEYHAKVIATSGALTFESERDLRLEYAVLTSYESYSDKREKLSDASEHNFCTAIRDAAGRALLSFATTAKQDCESLEHLKNSSANTEKDTNARATRRRRTKLAVEYRLAVKRALQKTYRIVSSLLLDAVAAARGEVWFPKLEDVVFEYLNESTKFVVSATAMVFLMFHPTVETCWCLLGSIVNSVNGKLLKRALNHSRPDGAKKVDPGMPSSHATSLSYLSWYAALAFAFEPNAFGLATTVTRTLAFGLVSLGAFLAYLRVKLGFHTWPQVYVGYGLGSSTALVWILFGKGYLIQHLARHPERLKNLHACLVVAIGLFALSAIKWVKELVKSSSKSKKQNAS